MTEEDPYQCGRKRSPFPRYDRLKGASGQTLKKNPLSVRFADMSFRQSRSPHWLQNFEFDRFSCPQ